MQNKITEIMDGILAESGIKLIDITIRGEKKNKVVEIFVDSEDFLDLDMISSLSRKFNDELDKTELKSDVLKFVISSPGADRPFLYVWQLKKYLGKVFEFDAEGTKYKGVLESLDEESGNLVFSVKKGKKELMQICRKFGDLNNLIISLPF